MLRAAFMYIFVTKGLKKRIWTSEICAKQITQGNLKLINLNKIRFFGKKIFLAQNLFSD